MITIFSLYSQEKIGISNFPQVQAIYPLGWVALLCRLRHPTLKEPSQAGSILIMNIKDPYSAAAAALSLGQHFLILEPEDVILDAEALASWMLLIPGLAAEAREVRSTPPKKVSSPCCLGHFRGRHSIL
jgi:hypothetical protein